jgi:CRISPR-associated protein Cas2
MPMTAIVTRDVPARTRGFLSSVMPEPAPGVYAGPEISKAVRERIYAVLTDWHGASGQGAVTLIWRDSSMSGGLGIKTLGDPPRQLTDLDGVLVSVW